MSDVFTNLCARSQAITSPRQASKARYGTLTLRPWACHSANSLGARAQPVPSGVAIGIYDQVADLLERVERYAAQGYRRVKIKIEPGWDIEPVAAVRARFPNLAVND